MSDERWQRVEEIYGVAATMPGAARARFVADACGSDTDLRADVESLLAQLSAAENFLETPALDVLARDIAGSHRRLSPGTRVGEYEIQGFVGAGGMGEVYRARDMRLHRDVAIKILSPLLLPDADSRRRLQREARVLASVNHPNVAAIYDVEPYDGGLALVLELVDGLSIGRRSARDRRSVVRILELARQIAAGLEAAHEKGIVHRDLKPDNVRVTPDGVVKVLDFGLAKRPSQDSDGTAGSATTAGAVAGTAAYMSPEQARGLPIDKRTDVWAFGAVLYELLSDRPAFSGATVTDVLANVLHQEPDWSALPSGTPASVRHLLARCLQKDARQRLRDIGDARLEIEAALTNRPEVATTGATPRRYAIAAVAGATVLTLIAAGWAFSRRAVSMPADGLVQFRAVFPSGDTPFYGVSVSPSGRQVAFGAFNGNMHLRLLSIDSPVIGSIAGTVTGGLPFWSPDGRFLAYSSDKKLMCVDLRSGEIVTLSDSSAERGGTWNSDGVIVFSHDGRLFRISDKGGTPAALDLETPDAPVSRSFPQFLPDGRHFLFHERTSAGGVERIGALDERKTIPLVRTADAAALAPPGYLLYLEGAALYAQRLNPQTLSLDGESQRVADNVAPRYLGGDPLFSAAGNVLAYVDGSAGSAGQLTWFDRGGRAAASLDQSDGGELLNPEFSPDGRRLAVNRMDPVTGNWDIWILDLLRGAHARLTTNPAQDSDPVWSPDGRFIAFTSMRDGHPAIYRKAVDGTGEEERLYDLPDLDRYVVPYQWTPDNKWLLLDMTPRAIHWDIWALPLTGGSRTPIRVFPDDTIPRYSPRVSPDGLWIAYASGDSGTRFDIYVQRFMAPGQRSLVSIDGGSHPRWRADGRELFYWAPPQGIVSVPLTFARGGFVAGKPTMIIPTPPLTLIDGRAHYDAAPDGQHFLLRQPASGNGGASATITLNWTQRLKR